MRGEKNFMNSETDQIITEGYSDIRENGEHSTANDEECPSIEDELVFEIPLDALDNIESLPCQDSECTLNGTAISSSDLKAALVSARDLIEKLRLQRDHHRLQHRRVEIERDRLVSKFVFYGIY